MPVVMLCVVITCIMFQNLHATYSVSTDNVLSQFQTGTENIINEINYVNTQISVNTNMHHLLQKTLIEKDYSADAVKLDSMVNSYLIPLIATKKYIDSMYVYMDNLYGRFVSVPGGLCSTGHFPDTSWYAGYSRNKASRLSIWCQPRSYRKYSFLDSDTRVISIYQKFYYGSGVSVVNLSADYFEDNLRSLKLYPGQIVFAQNDSGEILCSSDATQLHKMESMLHSITLTKGEKNEQRLWNGKKYYITQHFSTLGNIRYLSLTPASSLYHSVYQVYRYFLLAVILIVWLSVWLSYAASRQLYRNMLSIIELFSAAEKGESIADLAPPENIYGVLTQNIIKTFVRQNNMKLQLKENQYQNKVLELRSLQSRISPHFLFNTLKSIYWMCFQLTATNNKACRMIENMTDILDYALTEYHSLVPLTSEIRNTKNYIEIQQIRHNDQFRVAWDYPEELLECRTVKLLLQPLVENCIIHAFTWEGEDNCIKIHIYKKGDTIKIRIVDNGIGIPREKLGDIREGLKAQDDNGHIGIYNCSRRLALTFGSKYGLSIYSREGVGTMIIVTFPAHEG